MGLINGILAVSLVIAFTWLFCLTVEFSRFEKYDDSDLRKECKDDFKQIKGWLYEANLLKKEVDNYSLSCKYVINEDFKNLKRKVDALLEKEGLELQKVEEYYELKEVDKDE